MLLRRFTDFILRGRLQAIGAALVCVLPSIMLSADDLITASLVGLLSTAGIVITAFITLRQGVFEGFLILIAATLPVLIGDIESLPNFSVSSLDLTLVMLVSNLLTWMFAAILRRYSSWSLVLEVTAFICMVVVMLVHLLYPEVNAWWEMRLTSYFANSMQMLGQLNVGDAQAEKAQITHLVALAKPYMTGFLVSFVAFNALLQVLVARAWQARMFNPGGLRKELYAIRLSYAAGVVFILGLVLSYWGNVLITDTMPVLYFTFALAGLSLLHDKLAQTQHAWLWLIITYTLLMVVGMGPVALLALVDTGLNFRQRTKKFMGF